MGLAKLRRAVGESMNKARECVFASVIFSFKFRATRRCNVSWCQVRGERRVSNLKVSCHRLSRVERSSSCRGSTWVGSTGSTQVGSESRLAACASRLALLYPCHSLPVSFHTRRWSREVSQIQIHIQQKVSYHTTLWTLSSLVGVSQVPLYYSSILFSPSSLHFQSHQSNGNCITFKSSSDKIATDVQVIHYFSITTTLFHSYHHAIGTSWCFARCLYDSYFNLYLFLSLTYFLRCPFYC